MKLSIFTLVVFVMCLAIQLPAQEGVLQQYQAKFQKGLARIDSIFREKRLAMPSVHVKSLRQLEAEYQHGGQLENMLAVQQERKRFVLDPRGPSMPTLSAPPELAHLSTAYKQQFAAIAEERDRSREKLKKHYLVALKSLQVKLTQQGNIEDAKAVMQTISSLGGMVWKPVQAAGETAAHEPALSSTPAPSASAPAGNNESGESGDDFFQEWFN